MYISCFRARQFANTVARRAVDLGGRAPSLTSSALLVLDQADAGIMKAKGAFDPTAFAGRYDKYYDDKTYYSLFDAGVEVPLRGPFQLRAGYEQNSGQYLDPENTLPASGLWYGGIEVQLGQGLLIDERRAALQKALIQRELAEQELLLQVNQLLQDAVPHTGSGTWLSRKLCCWKKLAAGSRPSRCSQDLCCSGRQAIN